jgi:hypothetical protein
MPPLGRVEANSKETPMRMFRALAQSLSLTFGSTRALVTLRKTASDRSAIKRAPHGVGCCSTPKTPDCHPCCKSCSATPTSAAWSGLAAATIQNAGVDSGRYNSLDGSEKRDALNTLASRAAFAQPLLAAIARGTIPATLTAEIIRQLRNLKNAGIDAELQKVYGVIRETARQAKGDRTLQTNLPGRRLAGRRPRGRAVFAHLPAMPHPV